MDRAPLPKVALVNALLLDPEADAPAPGGLLLEDGRIAARLAAGEAPASAEPVDLGGLALAPGFLDLHYHGALVHGAPEAAAAALRETARELLASGVTGFLPTTVAWPAPELLARVGALAEACASGSQGGAAALGLHLEGPWISARAAGAQPEAGIRAFEPAEGARVFERAHGTLRMVTFAPELSGAAALQTELARRGIVAALGHSQADVAQVEGAVARGARHVTHLWNAMSGLHHRAPGLAGAALADDRLTCDLICDGVHVHPAAVRVAARAKRERLVLISDRVSAGAGFGAGALVDDGTALRLADGRLAGSRLTLDRALHNAVSFGAMTRLEAVAALTLRPARVLGLEREHGTLRPGARADLALLDADGRVAETWLAGRRAFRASESEH
jgi:N-acetylglucosamine-6-phosphate deacetylase